MRAPLRTCSEFPELSCRLFSELHQRQSMRLHRATVGYISVHLSLYYSTNGGCRVSPGTPVSLRFVPHAHGSEVRSLPLIITCPFAEPLCSCSPLTGFPAEKKGSCPQPGGFGQENPHSRGAANHALRNWVATGVLGNPAIALCAVPLLIPVATCLAKVIVHGSR